MTSQPTEPLLRRSFLSQVGTAGAAAAAIGLGTPGLAQAQSGTRFQPARHTQDDWMDAVPGKHRLYLDALTGPGAGEALLFAGNFMNANKSGYNLADADNAIIICMRHFATPFVWNDGIWAKYGEAFTGLTKLNDPKTGKAPTINLYQKTEYGMQLTNLGTTLDAVMKRGVQIAVCDFATHFIAGELAKGTQGNADTIYKELVASTVAGAHYVAAGIVATNRAQERGYALAHCG
jgi:hypothetical protein